MNELIKFILYSVLSTVIFLFIYSAVFYPEAITNMFDNIFPTDSNPNIKYIDNKSNNNLYDNPDTMVSSCIEDFEKYSKVGIDKYGFKYTIMKLKEVDNEEDAVEIYNLYSNPMSNFHMTKQYYESDLEYPLVIIAFKIEDKGGSLPFSIICNNGKLTDFSVGVVVL